MLILLSLCFLYGAIHLYLLNEKIKGIYKDINSMKHNKELCKVHLSNIKGIPHGENKDKS